MTIKHTRVSSTGAAELVPVVFPGEHSHMSQYQVIKRTLISMTLPLWNEISHTTINFTEELIKHAF